MFRAFGTARAPVNQMFSTNVVSLEALDSAHEPQSKPGAAYERGAVALPPWRRVRRLRRPGGAHPLGLQASGVWQGRASMPRAPSQGGSASGHMKIMRNRAHAETGGDDGGGEDDDEDHEEDFDDDEEDDNEACYDKTNKSDYMKMVMMVVLMMF